MKILIKTFHGTYSALKNNHFESHCSTYYTFLFRDIFRQLGHECDFVGLKPHNKDIITDSTGYDVLFYWGIESFLFDLEYSTELLKNFKGKKILYITAQVKYPIFQYFDYIFGAEVQGYLNFYKEQCPKSVVNVIPFASPMFDFIDKEKENPFIDNNPKVIYTGIITGRYNEILNTIAEEGINLYVGGIYAPPKEKGCRAFEGNEIKDLFSSKIKWLSSGGNFPYGSHFKYLKNASVGLNFYPWIGLKSKPINSKIIDYLVCGLPIVSDDESPNSYHINDLNAGIITKWNNLPQILHDVQTALNINWNKELIQKKARNLFNPLTVGTKILEGIK